LGLGRVFRKIFGFESGITFGLRGRQKELLGADLRVLDLWGQEFFRRLENRRVEQGHHVFVVSAQGGPVAGLERSGFAEIFLVIAVF
jgi:hypothetical protein